MDEPRPSGTNEPRWLTDEQQQMWRRLVEVLIRVPAALETQLQRDAGLTHMGYIVLLNLSEHEGRRMSMSHLAKRVNSSLSRLSHVVARLEGQGWLRRERNPQDGRVQIAVLTDAGFAKVVATAPGHVEAVQQLIFDRLTPAQVRAVAKAAESILASPLEVRPL